jgi:hypothetical protein
MSQCRQQFRLHRSCRRGAFPAIPLRSVDAAQSGSRALRSAAFQADDLLRDEKQSDPISMRLV